MFPNFREENKLRKRGYKVIVGIDEVGRGPLAGPVVACALCFKKAKNNLFIRDSKLLSPKQREEIYGLLRKDPDVEWGIGRVYQRTIDKINISEASKLAMKRAVNNLRMRADFLLIDGSFSLDLNIPQMFVVKGDQKVSSISAASVIAKVTRDRMMVNYCKKYPQYCFDKHKGYPTKLHRQLVKKHGTCSLHRQTFNLS